MKSIRFVPFISFLLVAAGCLASCSGAKISREQTLQILNQISDTQTDLSYGPVLVVDVTSKKPDGDKYIETFESYHVVHNDNKGISYVYAFDELFEDGKKVASNEYWAFTRNSVFNEIVKTGKLELNSETNEYEYNESSTCLVETNVVEAMGRFFQQYGFYYSKVFSIIKKYDDPKYFIDFLSVQVPDLIKRNFKVKDKYYSTGNGNVKADLTISRSTTGNDYGYGQLSFEYKESVLTSYYLNNPTTNTITTFTYSTVSIKTVPMNCEVTTN